jgi:hypothetical protein
MRTPGAKHRFHRRGRYSLTTHAARVMRGPRGASAQCSSTQRVGNAGDPWSRMKRRQWYSRPHRAQGKNRDNAEVTDRGRWRGDRRLRRPVRVRHDLHGPPKEVCGDPHRTLTRYAGGTRLPRRARVEDIEWALRRPAPTVTRCPWTPRIRTRAASAGDQEMPKDRTRVREGAVLSS